MVTNEKSFTLLKFDGLKLSTKKTLQHRITKFSSVLLILLGFSNVQAQNQAAYGRIVDFRKENSSVQLMKSIDNPIEVIVTSRDTISLGYLTVKKGNETIHLNGNESQGAWTSHYVRDKLNKASLKNDFHFKWIIRSLSLSSDTSSQVVFAHIDASVLARKGQISKYSLIENIDTITSQSYNDSLSYSEVLYKSLDLLYDISNNVSIKDIKEVNKANAMKFSLQGKEFTDSSLLNSDVEELAPKIMQDSLYAIGIYKTFNEFLNNAPSVTGTVWISPDTLSGNGHAIVYTMGTDSVPMEVKGAWGISLGGNELYKMEGGQLLPIEKSGSDFILSRFQDYRIRKNQALGWRFAMETVWPTDNNPYERKRSIRLKKFKGKVLPDNNQPVATKLNLSTGELSF